ncbi:uncharacterized protein LOC130212152 [Pseudoliparis swirei]|uniref:uncharacterized protein LOC130212152 n=1 Tax=Pseudoliparis swirei TaxID=2059687 RepID=UPI0024BDE421|nr:uncharacterized protein LOC130212152 [Pseudoliparis swirei]
MTSPTIASFVTWLFLCKMTHATDLTSSSTVRQERSFVSANVGENITLRCFNNNSNGVWLHWYKQILGQKPTLISSFYTFSKKVTFYQEFNNSSRFTLDTENGQNHLTVFDVDISDSATYYCAGSSTFEMTFAESIVVSVRGSGVSVPVLVHQSASETIQPGGSVTLSCTVHTGTCDGEHSVYWFKDSEESHPGLIYTHGGRNDQCERKASTQKTHTCVYNLPMKSLNRSDAGTYYCAVASCGHMLFGDGTKLDFKGEGDSLLLVYFLSGALLFATILIVLLGFSIYKVNKKTSCHYSEAHARLSAAPTANTEGQQHKEILYYAALGVHLQNGSRRPKDPTWSECVYYSVKHTILVSRRRPGRRLLPMSLRHPSHPFFPRPVTAPSASETIQPGGSVTLSCTVHTGTCDGEHSVYWFKDSEESHPGLIYTHGGRNDQCERKASTQKTHTCVYNLPMSDAGTDYCAVASCGHMLFGDGTKLDFEAKLHSLKLSDFLGRTYSTVSHEGGQSNTVLSLKSEESKILFIQHENLNTMTSPTIASFVTWLFLCKMTHATDLTSSSTVRQERSFVSANVGENITLRCFYRKSNGVWLHWYKQILGQKPTLISSFYEYSPKVTFHQEFNNSSRFTLDTENGQNHLTVFDVDISDSATYYCAGSSTFEMTFAEGIVVSVRGSGVSVPVLVHQSASETIQPGGSVTLNCTVHTGTCDGEHSVYWFKDSEESHPGLIYTHGGRNDQCERKASTQKTHTCVYNLPMKSLNRSDAGTYYCAVASCGHMLFGDGTKLDFEGEGDSLLLVYFLSGALLFATILIVLLGFSIYKVNKKTSCHYSEAHARLSAAPTANTEGYQSADNPHYAAFSFNRPNETRRQRNNASVECVYSSVKN